MARWSWRVALRQWKKAHVKAAVAVQDRQEKKADDRWRKHINRAPGM